MIHRQERTFFLDDVHLEVREVGGPVDDRERASTFFLEARNGDGLLSLKGYGNLFQWSSPNRFPEVAGGRDFQPRTVWSPSFALNVYLENIGVAAVGQMVSLSTLVPVSGAMTGQIEIEVRDRRVSCQSQLDVQNAAYGVNPASPLAGGQGKRLQQQVSNYRANGQMIVQCDGDLDNSNYRPHYAFQASLTHECVADAPAPVRAAAAWDYRRLSGQIADQSVNLLAADLTV